jgi:hypothetical protein
MGMRENFRVSRILSEMKVMCACKRKRPKAA